MNLTCLSNTGSYVVDDMHIEHGSLTCLSNTGSYVVDDMSATEVDVVVGSWLRTPCGAERREQDTSPPNGGVRD